MCNVGIAEASGYNSLCPLPIPQLQTLLLFSCHSNGIDRYVKVRNFICIYMLSQFNNQLYYKTHHPFSWEESLGFTVSSLPSPLMVWTLISDREQRKAAQQLPVV